MIVEEEEGFFVTYRGDAWWCDEPMAAAGKGSSYLFSTYPSLPTHLPRAVAAYAYTLARLPPATRRYGVRARRVHYLPLQRGGWTLVE